MGDGGWGMVHGWHSDVTTSVYQRGVGNPDCILPQARQIYLFMLTTGEGFGNGDVPTSAYPRGECASMADIFPSV